MVASAKTIAAGNVRVGMDGSGLYEGARKVKAEVAKFQQVMRETKNPMREVADKQAVLAKAFRDGKINAGELADRVGRLREKYGILNEGQRQAEASAKRLAQAHKDLADKKAREAAETARLSQELAKEAAQRRAVAAAQAKAAFDQQVADARKRMSVSAATMAAVNAKWSGGGGAGGGMMLNAASMAGAGNMTSLMGMGLRAGGIAAIAMGAVESIKLAASAEKAAASFRVLTGSVEDGKRLYSEMKALTASGLNLTDMQSSARTMLSFGVATDNVIPALKQIGEITGGDSLRFQMLSLAFSQSAAAGRLMGQDLLQMVNAGFNPLQEISRKTGKSLVDLRKDMENGAISFKMVQDAFASATGEGGKFNGMLAEQSKTLGGSWNQMIVQIKELGTAIGQFLSPIVTPVLQGMVELLKMTNWYAEKLVRGLKLIGLSMYDLATGDLRFSSTNKYLEELEKIDNKITKVKENWTSVKDQSFNFKPRVFTEDEKKLIEANKQYDDIAGGMREKLVELREGKDAAQAKKWKEAGMTSQMITELQNLERIVIWEEKQLSLKKEQAEIQSKMMTDGQRIADMYASPYDKMKKELSELSKLFYVGAIDAGTFERAGLDAVKKYQDASGNRNNESQAKSFEYGSREALAQMFGNRVDKQLEKLEQQRILQAEMVDIQRETRNSIQNMGIRAFK